jgi:hypothetical protein
VGLAHFICLSFRGVGNATRRVKFIRASNAGVGATAWGSGQASIVRNAMVCGHAVFHPEMKDNMAIMEITSY